VLFTKLLKTEEGCLVELTYLGKAVSEKGGHEYHNFTVRNLEKPTPAATTRRVVARVREESLADDDPLLAHDREVDF
jgi:hypothetical protein